MKIVLYPFMILGACGFLLSTAVQFVAFAGVGIPDEFFWGLHVGGLLAWSAAVLSTMHMMRVKHGKEFMEHILSGCPAWMRRGSYILTGYAILSFAVGLATTRAPNTQQNDIPPSLLIRQFAAFWIFFNAAAFIVLYSRIYSPQLYQLRKCPQGHAAAAADQRCSVCGYRYVD